MSEEDLMHIEDLPRGGPLEKYREAASFDWKKMKLFFEPIDLYKFKVSLLKHFKRPTFLYNFTEHFK